MGDILENVDRVRERIAAALERSGRSGQGVTIVGITKTFGPEAVNALIDAGVKDVGENRVQEFLAKRDVVGPGCRWHLVGHLQRNKAPKVVGRFYAVHSVDSLRIAEALDRLGAEGGVRTRVFLQVNTSAEQTKYGFPVEEAVEGALRVAELANMELLGLMTIGPVSVDPAGTRHCFRTLHRLREEINGSLEIPLADLSMGMSEDFEIAIEEGATVVRLGRVLLGERRP